MRWANQAVAVNGKPVDDGALPGLQRIGFVRSVRAPQFEGITFHEVLCKSALNKVPNAAALPFRYTVNGYRGCSHGCRYCFARPTHEYLDFNCGTDFDTQVVVKTNVAEVLRHELRRPSWQRETVALGTNTDPYQRAEGRYALMPGIIGALAESGTPLSILTKGTLLRRDLPLIAEAAQQVPVSVAVSLAVGDAELHRDVEPGTPTPQARLGLITAIRDAGLDCHVMVAPVLPHLTDSVEHLDRLLGQIAAAGATGVTVFGLHLRSSTRGWFMSWLARSHPELVGRYRELYRRGAYLPPSYREMLRERAAPLIAKYRLAGDHRPFPQAASSGHGAGTQSSRRCFELAGLIAARLGKGELVHHGNRAEQPAQRVMRRLDRGVAAGLTRVDVESREAVRVVAVAKRRPRRILHHVDRCLAPDRGIEGADSGQHAAPRFGEKQPVGRRGCAAPADDEVHRSPGRVDEVVAGVDGYRRSGVGAQRSAQRM